MIPLMFIQKKGNILAKTTAAITKMAANYRHLSRAIEIQYKMNIEDHFSLMIDLNEFDEPTNIYIKTLRNSEYHLVTPTQQTYTIESDREVVVIDYDTILHFAHNSIKYDEIKGMDIKAKMLNPHKDPDVMMTDFRYNENFAHFTINTEKFGYSQDAKTLMPILSYNDNTIIEPSRILGNYYIYDISLEGVAYEIALMHIKSFKNHYLFRQTTKTHRLQVKGNTLYDGYGISYTFVDGMVQMNKQNHSLQRYFDTVYGEEYKQYFFNAFRDKNLYTEIALAFDLAKHHSFNAYNYKTDERLMGKVITRAELNEKTIPEIVMELKNPLNQFLVKTEYDIQFRFPIYNLLHILNETERNYRLIDFGYFVVNGKIESISSNIINKEELDYVTASNNKWLFSISESYLEQILENMTIYLIPVIKNLDKNVFLPSNYNLRDINYLTQEVVLNNVFEEVTIPFSEVRDNPAIVVGKEATLFNSGLEHAFGIHFLINPDIISFNPVTPDIYDEVSLMVKLCEDEDYLIPDIEADTIHFSRAMQIKIGERNFMIILNVAKGYIYYLDLSNHTYSKEADGVDEFNTFMKVEKEDELFTILETFSLFIYIIKDNGYGVEVNSDLVKVPYMVYSDLQEPIISSKSGIGKITSNLGYYTRNNKIKTSFNISPIIYKEEFRGIFAGSGVELTSISLNNGKLAISGVYNGSSIKYDISISADGKYVCKDVFDKEVDLAFDKKVFDKSFGPISFNEYVAIDLNIVDAYIKNNTLTLNNQAAIFYGDKGIYINTTDIITTLDKSDNYTYTDKTVAALENWLGNELHTLTNLDNLEFTYPDNECYADVDIYKDDATTVHRVNTDMSKYIVLY